MKEPSTQGPSRRSFLRNAAAAAVLSPALAAPRATAQPAEGSGEDLTVLAQIKLDRELYTHDQVLHGTLRFLRLPQASIQVQWIDYFGRVAGEQNFPVPALMPAPISFSFEMQHGLSCMNAIRVNVGRRSSGRGSDVHARARPQFLE